MSDGTPKKRRDQPASDADRSRDLDKLNQQVVSSDLFGGGQREEDFSLRCPKWSVLPAARHFDHKLHFVGLAIGRTRDHFDRLRITCKLRDRTGLDLQRAADAVADVRKMAKVGAGHRVGKRIMKVFLRA
jgi:hypothetical protein